MVFRLCFEQNSIHSRSNSQNDIFYLSIYGWFWWFSWDGFHRYFSSRGCGLGFRDILDFRWRFLFEAKRWLIFLYIICARVDQLLVLGIKLIPPLLMGILIIIGILRPTIGLMSLSLLIIWKQWDLRTQHLSQSVVWHSGIFPYEWLTFCQVRLGTTKTINKNNREVDTISFFIAAFGSGHNNPHTIHGTGIFTYISLMFMVNNSWDRYIYLHEWLIFQ